MKIIKINGIGVNDTLDIVKEVRSQGLVQGRDFDFKYQKPTWDEGNYQQITDRHAEFKFYDDKYATLFGLRYGAR